MSPAERLAILTQLPEADHPEARRRIAAAEAMGWIDISPWQWVGRPTLADLTGLAVGPNGTVRLHFLSELAEVNDAPSGAD